MLALVFLITTIICACGWILNKVGQAALLWYLDEKGYPYPSDEEMRKGTRWAAEHFIQDAFRGKR